MFLSEPSAVSGRRLSAARSADQKQQLDRKPLRSVAVILSSSDAKEKADCLQEAAGLPAAVFFSAPQCHAIQFDCSADIIH
jgi:hypothetical protein